jgi:asparagine synthase (glutamine-hydrolysing)
MRRHLQAVQDHDLATQRLHLDTMTYLPGDILTKVDRMSMAVSLEARVPLLDHKVAELAASIPPELKLKGLTTKYILKQAARELLPPEIIDRPKHGFNAPINRWFNADWAGRLDGLLFDRTARERGIFDAAYLRSMLDEHRSGRRNHDSLLWAVMMLEMWHRRFVDDVPETETNEA